VEWSNIVVSVNRF